MSNNKTLGLIETRGLTAMTYALDEMLKGTNIKIEGYQMTGSAYVAVAVSGSTEDVINSLNIGKNAVNTIAAKNSSSATARDGLGKLISTYVIPKTLVDIINIFFINKPGINYPKTGMSIGFIDGRGLISLISAADVMSKVAPIEILGYQKMGSGRLDLAISGDVESVKQAIKIGITLVKEHGKLISHYVINNPHPGISEMLK